MSVVTPTGAYEEIYGAWESEVLAFHNQRANDPYEPFQGVASVWNGNAYLRGLRDREAWLIDSAYELSRPSEEMLRELKLD